MAKKTAHRSEIRQGKTFHLVHSIVHPVEGFGEDKDSEFVREVYIDTVFVTKGVGRNKIGLHYEGVTSEQSLSPSFFVQELQALSQYGFNHRRRYVNDDRFRGNLVFAADETSRAFRNINAARRYALIMETTAISEAEKEEARYRCSTYDALAEMMSIDEDELAGHQ